MVRGVLIIFIAVLAIAAWIFLNHDRPTEGRVVLQPHETGVKSVAIDSDGSGSDTDPEREESVATESTNIATWRKRIDQAPEADKDNGKSSAASDQEHAEIISRTLDSALGGNIEDAVSVLKYLEYCNGAERNEQSLNSRIQLRGANPYGDLKIYQRVFNETVVFDRYEEWVAAKQRQYQECRITRHLFGSDLRSRLESQALNGDVLARFMYAMWSPPYPKHDPYKLIEGMGYTSLAYQFTIQNINEKEPLGLLAIGLSFRSGKFTPRRVKFGRILMLAAQKCSVHESFADIITFHLTSLEFDTISTRSEAIARELCM